MTLAHADILTRSGDARPYRSASAAQRGPPRPPHHLEVPGRSRAAPGRDGRLLRAALAGAVHVPGALAARVRRPDLGELVPDPRARPHPSRPVDHRPPEAG